jgi:uncharacterized protein (TIGR03435 family)
MFRKLASIILLGSMLLCSRTNSQPPHQDPQGNDKPEAMAFEVATVKPSGADEIRGMLPSENGFSARGVLIMQLIWFAYRGPDASERGIIRPEQINGLPAWTTKSRYDIEAKLPPEITPSFQKLRSEQRRKMLQQMMASLLADRFKMRIHFEMKNQPVYELVVKDHSKLKESPLTSNSCLMNWGGGFLDFRDCAADELATNLSSDSDIGRIVVNRTGLQGVYDFHLKWAPNGEEAIEGPSLFSALEEQLGLRLVSTKAPVDMLVVDSIATPSPN